MQAAVAAVEVPPVVAVRQVAGDLSHLQEAAAQLGHHRPALLDHLVHLVVVPRALTLQVHSAHPNRRALLAAGLDRPAHPVHPVLRALEILPAQAQEVSVRGRRVPL